jgi:hypothetical protein
VKLHKTALPLCGKPLLGSVKLLFSEILFYQTQQDELANNLAKFHTASINRLGGEMTKKLTTANRHMASGYQSQLITFAGMINVFCGRAASVMGTCSSCDQYFSGDTTILGSRTGADLENRNGGGMQGLHQQRVSWG